MCGPFASKTSLMKSEKDKPKDWFYLEVTFIEPMPRLPSGSPRGCWLQLGTMLTCHRHPGPRRSHWRCLCLRGAPDNHVVLGRGTTGRAWTRTSSVVFRACDLLSLSCCQEALPGGVLG